MDTKDLRKLSRHDLLEILVSLSEENDELKKQLEHKTPEEDVFTRLEKKCDDVQMLIENHFDMIENRLKVLEENLNGKK